MNTSFDHKDTPKNQRHSQHESQSAKTHPSRTIVHAKLEMTDPGDHDEQEADAIADAVVSGGKISRKISSGGGGSSGIAVSQQMESQLSQLQGGGRPMPEGLRNMMENGFGRDFSQVRLHTDSQASDMSSSISARAFTHGNDIYFNRGQFSPNTSEGQRLVAHELTHVAQGTRKVGRTPNSEETSEKENRVALIFYAGGEDLNMRKKQAEAVETQLKGNGKYYHEGGLVDSKNLNVKVIQFDAKTDMINAINNESNIIYLSVFSHGFIRGIISGSDYFEPQDVPDISAHSFNPVAKIYLNGCHNGEKGIDNTIAQAMASHLGVTVYAFDDGVDYLKKEDGHSLYNGFMAEKGMGKKRKVKSHNEFSPKNDFVDFEIASCKYENDQVIVDLNIKSKETMSSLLHLTKINLDFCDKFYKNWVSLKDIISVKHFADLGLVNRFVSFSNLNILGNKITITFKATDEFKDNLSMINEVQVHFSAWSAADWDEMTYYNYKNITFR